VPPAAPGRRCGSHSFLSCPPSASSAPPSLSRQAVYLDGDGRVMEGPDWSLALITQDNKWVWGPTEGVRHSITLATLAQLIPGVSGQARGNLGAKKGRGEGCNVHGMMRGGIYSVNSGV
jgi:hypothetical protein